MKALQLLIVTLLITSFTLLSCTTLTTVGDKALGYGPPDGISSAVMIGGAIVADGIIYLWDHSDEWVQPSTPEASEPLRQHEDQ